MAIMRWAPFSAFASLEREMQDMLDRFGSRPLLEGFEWKPSTDIYREGDKLIVRAEIPGIDPEEELTVELKDGVLHISGEKKVEKEISEDNRYLKECRYGSFRRQVVLPEGVDPESIHADFDNGILMVTVPVPVEKALEPSAIAVEVKKPKAA